MGVKSNYFRHSFNAHLDTKIRTLIQRKGPLGYAAYFVLLEIYCSKIFDDDKRRTEQEVDLKLLGSYLGVRSDSAHSCLIVMEELELIDHLSPKYNQTMVKLRVHKALKYFGKYEKVSEQKCPNKSKEKEIKEKEKKRKEIKENIGEIDLEFIAQCWNDTAIKHGLQTCPMVLGGKILESVFVINTHLKNNAVKWEEYFDLLGRSDFLKSKKGSPLNLTWALNEENLFKALSGAFNDEFKTGHSRENPYLAELRKLEAKNGK